MKSADSPELRGRLAGLLGWRPATLRTVTGGYTPAARWLADGPADRVFVKMGTTPGTVKALRSEANVYERLEGAFMPRRIAWEDDEHHPILILEDLSDAQWPPPWSPALVDSVQSALAAVHAMQAPLPEFGEIHGGWTNGWRTVESDPEPLATLGLVSRHWLQECLPLLVQASDEVATHGLAVTHFDVRSDNLCLAARGVVLVDWNGACLGNAELDLGFWLPSLEFEGGPPPDEILAGRPDIAAAVSGFFAA